MSRRVEVSVWAQDLANHLIQHMDNEREALRAYGELVASTADPRVRLLAEQILADEVRHHQQLADLREALLAEIEGRSARPAPGRDRPDELLTRTEALIRLEKDDIGELRRLARQLRKVEDIAWQAFVVEAMELDTRKHIRLLEGIAALLRGASTAGVGT